MTAARLPPRALAAVAVLAACATAPRAPGPAAPTAAAAPPGPGAAMREADEALRQSRLDLAAERYEEAARLSPTNPWPLLGLAQVRFASGKIPEGLALLDRSIAAGETVPALVLRGRTLGVARRFDEAARDLERAGALAPADGGGAWPILAAVQVNRGDELAARRAFDAAAEALGTPAAVDRLWTMLLAMPPDPVEPQESLDRCARGHAAMFEGRWPQALHEQRNGLKYAPDFAWCVALAGESTWRLGDAAGAERLLRRAIPLYPEWLVGPRADTKAKLAALLVEKGEAKEAAELARASLAARGDRAATLDVLARACAASGDAACARDASARLLRLPGVPDPLRGEAERRIAEGGPAR